MSTPGDIAARHALAALVAGITLGFAGLKLTGVVDWGWLWVASPVWIALGVIGAMVLIFMLGIVVGDIVMHLLEQRP